MNIQPLLVEPIVALVAGVLILAQPRLLNGRFARLLEELENKRAHRP
jgi:hypothetical protein